MTACRATFPSSDHFSVAADAARVRKNERATAASSTATVHSLFSLNGNQGFLALGTKHLGALKRQDPLLNSLAVHLKPRSKTTNVFPDAGD
jgi:hypothetical protein